MTPFQLLKRLWITATWSRRPEWISPPLRGTRFRRGRRLRRLWVHRSYPQAERGKTYIGLGTINIDCLREKRELLNERVVIDGERCREQLAEALGLPAYESLAAAGTGDRLLRLDLAIVEARPGSLYLRGLVDVMAERHLYLLALLGFGHAWVQIEGILFDPDRQAQLVKFVERRRSSGSARVSSWWGDSWGDVLVRDLIEAIAQDILLSLHDELIKGRPG